MPATDHPPEVIYWHSILGCKELNIQTQTDTLFLYIFFASRHAAFHGFHLAALRGSALLRARRRSRCVRRSGAWPRGARAAPGGADDRGREAQHAPRPRGRLGIGMQRLSYTLDWI